VLFGFPKFFKMPITFRCPECGGLLSVPKKMQGQTINCPMNGCLIQVAGNGAASLAAAGQAAPATSSTSGTSIRPAPAPAPLSAPPAAKQVPAPTTELAPAQPSADWLHRNVAKFIASDKTASPIQLAVDGRLPELNLQEGADRRSAAESAGGTNPLVLTIVLCLSVVMSTMLLFVDFGPPQSQISSRAEARRKLAEFYRQPREELLPYQQSLRDAQQAHSRGDHETEQELYRRVLRLLHAEGRSRFASVTRTPREDKELEALLAILMAEE
jgi:hypothetical protein